MSDGKMNETRRFSRLDTPGFDLTRQVPLPDAHDVAAVLLAGDEIQVVDDLRRGGHNSNVGKAIIQTLHVE